MNYEQKYKDALKWMQGLYSGLHGATKEEAERYFPELKESDDEKIRKKLIEHIKANYEADYVLFKKFTPDDVIAWLEEQGKKKSAEWSEEDKQMILSIEQVMNCASLLNIVPEKIDNIKSWLKSLRPQKQWKPSEAQLIVIKDLIEDKSTSKVNKVILRGMLREIDDAEIEKQNESTITNIEIPFGANDSELQEVTYYIPKGFHAEIDDDKVVIKKGEKSAARRYRLNLH